jgi:O-antigen ligase
MSSHHALNHRLTLVSPLPWALAGGVTAIAIGAAAAWSPREAVAIAIAAALVLALAFRPANLLPVLVASVFAEVVSLGGITIGRLVAPVALLVVLIVATERRLTLRFAGPVAWATFYAGWALASGLWTVNLSKTAFMLGSLAIALVYAFAFAVLIDSERELLRVSFIVAVAALGIGIFAVIAFAVGVSGDLNAGRSEGGSSDPNLFATYQVMALPLALVVLSEARNRLPRFVLYGSALAVAASVFASLSRGGILTLLFVTALIVILPSQTLFHSSRQKAVLVLFSAIAAGVFLWTSSSQLVPRFESLRTGDTSGSGRLYVWRAALISVHEHPTLGIGYGAFPDVSNELLLRTPGVDFNQYELRPAGTVPHNLYLGTLAELGVPGLVLLAGLLLSTAVTLVRAASQARRIGAVFLSRSASGLLVSLLGVGVASVFLSTDTSRALWILLGMSVAAGRLVTRRVEEEAAA